MRELAGSIALVLCAAEPVCCSMAGRAGLPMGAQAVAPGPPKRQALQTAHDKVSFLGVYTGGKKVFRPLGVSVSCPSQCPTTTVVWSSV